ncbi:MAG: glycosyltransferase family 39 protein [Gemmataceae bacterium]
MIERWLPEWACPWITLSVLVVTALLRLLLLVAGLGLDLSPDEAHYWDWSRHLDWSYYSKGPLVAWIIAASTALLGPLSESLTGHLTFAIRAPAVVFGTLMLGSLYVLTVQVCMSRRLGLLVVLGALTHPIVTAGSSLITIDSPYACAWGWACVLALHAIRTEALWAWFVAGMLVGLGILAKYTMVVFVPCVALYLLLSPPHRRLLFTPGPWLLLAVASLAAVPILIWNAQHEWVSFHHVAQLAGLKPREPDQSSTGIHWFGPLHYLGGQFVLLLGTWFVLWAVAVVRFAPWWEVDEGRRFLWCLSVPMFLLFLGFSPKTGGGELNWPVTAYLTGSVLAAIGYGQWRQVWMHPFIGLTCMLGLLASGLLYVSPALHPMMELFVGQPTKTNPTPVRKLDPTCRLRGWRDLAAAVDEICEQLRRRGEDPVLVGTSWTLPGQLGVYCREHPQAYCIGSLQGERLSQYDLWLNPMDHPESFRDRTFVLIGSIYYHTLQAFEEVEPAQLIRLQVQGRPLAEFPVWVARGFRGFPPRPKNKH